MKLLYHLLSWTSWDFIVVFKRIICHFSVWQRFEGPQAYQDTPIWGSQESDSEMIKFKMKKVYYIIYIFTKKNCFDG